MMNKGLISFAIPVYNNQGSLSLTHQQIQNHILTELPGYDYEIIFVNDGSKDGSLEELHQIREKDKNVIVINFSKNFGQLPATIAGTRKAKGNVVIVLSADLQDPIEMVAKMVKEWEQGSKIVICYRAKREDSFLNKITSRVYFGMLRYHTNKLMPEGGFDYYLLDRKPIDALNSIEDKIRGLHYDIFSLGFSIKLLPYNRLERLIGKSQYNFTKRLGDFLNAFISISYIPIRAMTFAGVIFALCGFIYAFSIIFAWFRHNTPFEGWAPIMVILLVTSGLIMIMLGII